MAYCGVVLGPLQVGRGGRLGQRQEVIDGLHGHLELGAGLHSMHKVLGHAQLGQVQQGQRIEDTGYVQGFSLYMHLQYHTHTHQLMSGKLRPGIDCCHSVVHCFCWCCLYLLLSQQTLHCGNLVEFVGHVVAGWSSGSSYWQFAKGLISWHYL